MGAAVADDRRGIVGLLARCGRHSQIAAEASGPTWATVDRLVEQVAAVHVVDRRKTRIKAAFAAKTDRLDAQRLADALRRDSVVGIDIRPWRFATCGNWAGIAVIWRGCRAA